MSLSHKLERGYIQMSWIHSQRSIMWQTAPSRGQRCSCHLSGETVQGFLLWEIKWRLIVFLRFSQFKNWDLLVILSRPRGPPTHPPFFFFFLMEQLTQKNENSVIVYSAPPCSRTVGWSFIVDKTCLELHSSVLLNNCCRKTLRFLL